MLKAVLFDLDGVLTLDSGSRTLSKNLCEERVDLVFKDLLASFRKDMEDLTLGRCPLRSVIERVCKEFSIPFSEDLLLKITRKANWNTPMIELSRSLSPKYVRGIITDNSEYRIKILAGEPELAGFDPIIVSAVEHALKSGGSKKLFEQALDHAGCTAPQAIFIDNKEENLVTPRKMGILTHFHDEKLNNVQALRMRLQELGVEMSAK